MEKTRRSGTCNELRCSGPDVIAETTSRNKKEGASISQVGALGTKKHKCGAQAAACAGAHQPRCR